MRCFEGGLGSRSNHGKGKAARWLPAFFTARSLAPGRICVLGSHGWRPCDVAHRGSRVAVADCLGPR